MTSALNQLVFVPELLNDQDFHWIRHRKVVYIPKIPPKLASPGDYRPLSKLEVLYKIPSRILSARLSRVLPTIIGSYQHGFMAQRGIQELSLLATHLIQDAVHYQKPLQLVSFDMEKAFDRVGHHIIVQALLWSPRDHDHGITALHAGWICFCRGQWSFRHPHHYQDWQRSGDPLSSILFLIAMEPLNRLLASSFPELM
jgi:hypothetical protein